MNQIQLLGIAGSLRKGSYNRKLLQIIHRRIPGDVEMEIHYLDEIPLYNMDIEKEGFPEAVKNFQALVSSCDGIIIASPEYNYGIPGVLKNAIDWTSRPFDQNPFDKKPCAICSASASQFGGARAQQHLRQVLSAIGMLVMPQPELYIPKAQNIFDENQEINETTLKRIDKLIASFIVFIKKHKA